MKETCTYKINVIKNIVVISDIQVIFLVAEIKIELKKSKKIITV